MDRKLKLRETTFEIKVGKAFSDLIDPKKKNLLIPNIKRLRDEINRRFNIALPPVKVSDENNLENCELQILIGNKLRFKDIIDIDISDEEKVQIIINKLKELCI